MALSAILYVDDDVDERRAAPRRPVGQQTTLRESDKAVRAVLHDLSTTGASVETPESLEVGAILTIGLAGVGRFPATVVSVAGTRFGCRFLRPLSPAAVQGAFASDPVVVGRFAEPEGAAAPPCSEKFPGVIRLALPIGGAITGWALILRVVSAILA